MRILFLTIPTYDYLADSLLIGLRELYGDGCVDYPRKAIMYGEVSTKYLYGRGFTIWSLPIQDIARSADSFRDIDLVIYGNVRRQKAIDWRALIRGNQKPPRVIYLDGNDDTSVELGFQPYYKRELRFGGEGIFPISFSIPGRLVREIDLGAKTQLFQSNNQDPEINAHAFASNFQSGTFSREASYLFSDEKDYYDDLARSYFGITKKKAGWDCMRHYEILAAGSLLLFKNLNDKPAQCAPHCRHFLSYSSKEDLMHIVTNLVPDDRPSAEYRRILGAQRTWLMENATSEAQAKRLIDHVKTLPQTTVPADPLTQAAHAQKLLSFYFNAGKEELLFKAMLAKKKHPRIERCYRHALSRAPAIRRFISSRLFHERPSITGHL